MTVESHSMQDPEWVADRPAQFRYGVVVALTLALVVFLIAAPSADWSRAVALAVGGGALVFALATARERKDVRYANALVVGCALLVVCVAVATGIASWQLTDGVGAVVTAAIPLVIFRGVVRLLRDQGVTVQAVAGALAIYLAVGLLFAWIIGFIAHVDSTPYFAQHTNGTEGDRVYFSFTVLTTTGFGDFFRRDPGRPRARGDRDAHRTALPGHGHRAADRQPRQQAQRRDEASATPNDAGAQHTTCRREQEPAEQGEVMSPIAKVFELDPKGPNLSLGLAVLEALAVPLIFFDAVSAERCGTASDHARGR
jgi:Ion channel